MNLTEIAATGTFKATPTLVKTIILTPAAATAIATIRDGGAGGVTKATLQALVSGNSTVVRCENDPITFSTDVHVTISGAGALVYIGY